jgi:hypothetical protein
LWPNTGDSPRETPVPPRFRPDHHKSYSLFQNFGTASPVSDLIGQFRQLERIAASPGTILKQEKG